MTTLIISAAIGIEIAFCLWLVVRHITAKLEKRATIKRRLRLARGQQ